MTRSIQLIIYLISTNLLLGQGNVYVLGNEGILNLNTTSSINAAPDRTEDDILVYLGNGLGNISKSDASERVGELRKKFKRVYLVPGQAEWDNLKSKKLKKLGDYLDDEYKGDVIVPENSCGAIEVKEVGDDVALVFIDSEWYFNDWEEDKSLNKGCTTSSREEFWTELGDEIGGLKAKRVILFAYHPIMRFDAKGGYHSASEQLFPLADIVPGLYLPLPVIGTLIADTRSYFTPRQNVMSTLYQEYSQGIKNVIKDHGQVTLITSEAKYNSVFTYRECLQLNVNTNTDHNKVSDRGTLVYSSQIPSFIKLTLTNGQNSASFYDLNHTELYTSNLNDENQYTDKINPSTLPRIDMSAMTTRPIRYDEDLVNLNTTLFGNLNKTFYQDSVSVPKLDLSTHLGGLTPVRLGGGMQTVSLRLRDSTGHIYLARSLKKDPEKSIPVSLRLEPFENVVEYYYMAANPLGFLTAQPLEEAANILHTTPKLMQLPLQPKLAPYNDEIGGEIILFRQRADGDWKDKKSYGYSEDVISSSKMINAVNDNKGTIDAEMYLRARLVDYMINDWDRHADQWRWAEIKEGDQKIYKPIPRDRDQVFSKFDGLVMKFLKPYSPNFTQLRNWDDHLTTKDVRWMHFKSAYLDNLVLHQLSNDQWQEQTDYLVTSLTEDVQNEALSRLPSSYASSIPEMKHNLKSRIDELQETSSKLKSELRYKSMVRGSNESDSIIININKKEIEVAMYSEEDDEYFEKFKNTFNESECNEIWIYGLDDDDTYYIVGDNTSKIKITLIGGYGKDRYHNLSKHNNIHIYDDHNNKNINEDGKTSVKYHRTKDKELHALNRFDITPTHTYIVPRLSYNTDDGLLLGAQYVWNKTGFKSKSKHVLGTSYMTQRSSLVFDYSYRTTDLLTDVSKYAEAYYSGTQRQLAYYGGNDSPDVTNNEFYNVDLSDARLELGLSKMTNPISQISAGIYGWSVLVDQELDDPRYILEAPQVDPNIFERNNFGGLKVDYTLSNFDNAWAPTKGARMQISADSRFLLDEKVRSNLSLRFEYDYYKNIFFSERLIFSTKLRVGHIFGDFYLYEGNQLGGLQTLRGTVQGRYTGRTSFAHNTNLHFRLFDRILPKFLPSAMGVTVSYDNGRVWSDYDISDQWLHSYGAGIWIKPLDIAVLSLSYHRAKDSNQIRALFGWQF